MSVIDSHQLLLTTLHTAYYAICDVKLPYSAASVHRTHTQPLLPARWWHATRLVQCVFIHHMPQQAARV